MTLPGPAAAQSLAQLRCELPGAPVIPFWFDDLADETGLATLRSWLGSGLRFGQERAGARRALGDGSVIAWQAVPRTRQR